MGGHYPLRMPRPRVGFDVSALAPPASRGLARVVSETVAALERRGRLEVVRLAPPAGAGTKAWRQRALPRAVRAHGLAGLHSFTSAFPLAGPGKRVQTIHELPWRHGVREHAGPRHRAWALVGPWRADRVVCPTQHVAADLARTRLSRTTRTVVVPWGVGPPFAEEPPAGSVDEPVLQRYGLGEEPFALCLGAVRPKKNLAAVVRGLAELAARRGGEGRGGRGAPPLRLVVTGGDTPSLRRDLGLASRLGLARFVLTVDEIAEPDLAPLLRLAACVPVLSSSEGFGLAVLEALACGTPVIVPRASAQAEVAGEAGLVVDADAPGSVAEAFERALGEREQRRAALLRRAALFSWERTAERIEALWEELA